MDRFAEAYRAELNAFLDVAMGRRASPCTPQEALEVAWIAEAATQSLRQHRPIKMDEVRS
jgi:myo-inositol 2-dehydrogenase/D-chiro-inositol 1-dehydrogenase